MRILFLSSIYPRPYNPVRGVYCRSVCRALAAQQHSVHVISPVAWTDRLRSGGASPAADDGFPVEYPTFYYPPGLMRNRHGWFMWRSARRAILRAVREFRPECVLSYWLDPEGYVAVRTARAAGVPSAVIVGGSDARILPNDPKRRAGVLCVLAEADALLPVSQGLKDDLVRLGTPEEKVHVIYQGIDHELFFPGDRREARRRLGLPLDQKAVVFVGGLLPVKGLSVLLQATARLVNGGTDFHVYLVGGGPLRTELTAMAADLGVSRSVTFVGPQPQDRLPDWYRAADLSVLSSLSEGIPNVLRESLACGTPFVATRVGDVAEFCPDAAGDLVPPGDPAALAAALGRALHGHPSRLDIPQPASWEECADEMVGVLENLVLRHRVPGARPASLPAAA